MTSDKLTDEEIEELEEFVCETQGGCSEIDMLRAIRQLRADAKVAREQARALDRLEAWRGSVYLESTGHACFARVQQPGRSGFWHEAPTLSAAINAALDKVEEQKS